MSTKPLIHFAHANGVPSKVYQKLFEYLQDDYDIIYVPLIGADKRYPISNHWLHLVDQIVDSIVQQNSVATPVPPLKSLPRSGK